MARLRRVLPLALLASLAVPGVAAAADLAVVDGVTTITPTVAGQTTVYSGSGTVDRLDLESALASGDVRLDAATIDLGPGVTAADGAPGRLTLDGDVEAAEALVVRAGGGLAVTGDVVGTGGVDVQLGATAGPLTVGGVSGAVDDLTLAGSDVSVQGAVAATGRLWLFSSGAVTQLPGASVAAAGLSGFADALSLTDPANTIGRLSFSAGTAAVRTSGALDLDGVVTVTDGVDLRAGGAITQSAANLVATTLTATAGGPVTLRRANLVTRLGDVDAPGVDLRSDRDLTVAGYIDAGTGDATLRGAVSLALAPGAGVAGRDVVLDTGGAFANGAGAAAVTASRRWLVYAATSAGSTFGGLDSGSAPRWGAPSATAPPTGVTGTRYLFAERPTATLTPAGLTKAEGTDGTAAVAATPVAVSGLRPAVAGAYRAGTAFTGTPAVTSAGAPAGAAAGAHPITVDLASVTAADGYALAAAPGTLTVTAAPARLPQPAPAQPQPLAATPPACTLPATVRVAVRLPRGTRAVTATLAGRLAVRRTGRRATVVLPTAGLRPGTHRLRVAARVRGGRTVVTKPVARVRCQASRR